MQIKFVTSALTREALLADLQALISDAQAAGISSANLSFGWDSNIPIDEMWKPQIVALDDLVAHILRAEDDGVIEIGASDVFVDIASMSYLMSHESDLFLKGEDDLAAAQVERWRCNGYSPTALNGKAHGENSV